MSDKSVFGQCGPKNINNLYSSQQTICRKFLKEIKNQIFLFRLQNTMKISNNYYYSFLVKMFVNLNNPQITISRINRLSKFEIIYFFELSLIVGISEAIRLLLIIKLHLVNINILSFFAKFRINLFFSYYTENTFSFKNVKYSSMFSHMSYLNRQNEYDNKRIIDPFNEWLSGIIDGDGCFLLSKKGYASLEITIQLRDVRCLNHIKQRFGGSIKVRANQNHLRYRLHHKEGLLNIIKGVNGLIRNPIRMMQLAKICEKYDIPFYYPDKLTYNNGWLSGFVDTDGSVYLNIMSDQIYITASQKNKLLLDPLIDLYGGSIYLSNGKEHFKWIVYKKKEVIHLLDYFKLYPLKSAKLARINLIPKYYELRKLGAHRASENSVLGKGWKQFLIKWNSYDDE